MTLGMLATSAMAHEVWIAPADYQVASGVSTTANLLNGEKFAGSGMYYNPDDTVRLEHHHNGTVTPIEGRLGDTPAIRTGDLKPGLHTIVYQSTFSRLHYAKWEKFAKFAAHKNFPNIEARHNARNLPREPIRESYARYAKALIAVGDGRGSDRAVGLDTDIVALANPYTTAETTLPVRVLYNGAPRADAQVEVFEKAPAGQVAITLHRTDDKGEARLPIKRGHTYLVDAVVLREPVRKTIEGKDVVWETLWAALTFAIPPEK